MNHWRIKKHTYSFDGETPDLCHEAVRSGALFVPEYDVRVVVGHEVPEARVLAGNPSLGESARRQRVLRHVGHVLFEDERGQFAGPTASARPSAWPTPRRHAHRGQEHDRDPHKHPRPHRLTRSPSLHRHYVTPLFVLRRCLDAAPWSFCYFHDVAHCRLVHPMATHANPSPRFCADGNTLRRSRRNTRRRLPSLSSKPIKARVSFPYFVLPLFNPTRNNESHSEPAMCDGTSVTDDEVSV